MSRRRKPRARPMADEPPLPALTVLLEELAEAEGGGRNGAALEVELGELVVEGPNEPEAEPAKREGEER